MNGLEDISISIVETTSTSGELRANVRAILHEIETLLGKLLESGEGDIIDIRSLPLLPADYEGLEGALGGGEVYAEIDGGNGPTVIVETGMPGVWWVSHYGDSDEIIAEFIEVTRIPELLMSPPEDIDDGLERLRMQLADAGH